MEERCTTCYYFQIPLPERYCGHPAHNVPLGKNVHRRCRDYISMYDKGHIDRAPKLSYEQTMRKHG